nr:autotransporter domain-containing protein [uncultured Sphingomonas sp.]
MTKTFIGAALVGASMLAFTTPATAQRIDRVVSFGDSYADTGNAFKVIMNDPLVPAGTKAQLQQVYPTGRFSGGTNYIDTLGQILGAPIDNYAVGGGMAGTFPVPFGSGASNNVSCGPGVVAGSPDICPMGFTYEVDQFLNVGTQNPIFPTGSSALGPNDLVTVSIGGNDARYYQQNYSAYPMAPFVAGSITAAGANLDRLVSAGAQNISFLAGDTGRLPEVLADPAAAALRTTYSTQFNAAMQSKLSAYAANGVMVHYLDLNKVLDNVLANPAAYGITNGTAASAYTCPTPTPTAPGCLLNSSGYMFYVDGLHLTSDGFAIVARYVAAQLRAPLTLQASSDMGLLTATQWGKTLTSRMDGSAPRDGNEATGMSFYLLGDTAARTLKAGAHNDQFRASSVGATAGVEFGFGTGSAGLAVNYSRPKANFENDAGNVKGRSIQVGGYGSFGFGPLFAQAYAGYGWDKAKITRLGVVEDMRANPKGNHLVIGGKAGYLMTVAEMRVGPVIGLDYAKAKVDGYTETGDQALTLNVSNVNYKTLRGSAGLEVRGDMGDNGVKFRPYGSVVVEKDFTGDGRAILFSQTASPTIVNSFDFDKASKKAYGRFSAGFSAEITGGLSAVADASTTLAKKQGNETSARAGLKLAF